MESEKQACVHCGALIASDSQTCPDCGSKAPFTYLCPTCLQPVEKDQYFCDKCARPLTRVCPHCGYLTFVGERCDCCGKSLMVHCSNKHCGAPQFFQNVRCNVCGKKIKETLKKD